MRGIAGAGGLVGWLLAASLALGTSAGLAQDRASSPAYESDTSKMTCRSAFNARFIDDQIQSLTSTIEFQKQQFIRFGSGEQRLTENRRELARLKALPPCPPEPGTGAKPPTSGVPIPLCRSAENATEIDTTIAELQKRIATLANREKILTSARAADAKAASALSGSFGPADSRTKAAQAVLQQDDEKLKALQGDLEAARAALAQLEALKPCSEQKPGATPQPPATPQPAPGGRTPIPPCRSVENSAQIDT